MKILKRINNNTVICVNAKGRELVAIGRGIGFPNGPDESHSIRSSEPSTVSTRAT